MVARDELLAFVHDYLDAGGVDDYGPQGMQVEGSDEVSSVVTGVSASDNTDSSQVVVQWTDITGETGYGIWRYTANTSNSASWVGNAAANATTYNDTSATPGVQYYYWVMGTNSTSSSMSGWTRRLSTTC